MMTKIRPEHAMQEYARWVIGNDLAPYTDEYINNKYRRQIADAHGVPVSKVKIWYCGPVDEYCVYINGKWSGYLELNE